MFDNKLSRVCAFLFLILALGVPRQATALYSRPCVGAPCSDGSVPIAPLANPTAPNAGVCSDGTWCTTDGAACADSSTCTQRTTVKVLMAGDSIGMGAVYVNNAPDFSGGGFMAPLDALNVARGGVPYQWVGRFPANPPSQPYATSSASGYWIADTLIPSVNETAPGVQRFFPDDAVTYSPDIVILYAGINTIKGWDLGSSTNPGNTWGWGNDAAYAAEQYLALVTSIHNANPQAMIVMSKIAPLSPTLAETVNGAYPWLLGQIAIFNRLIEQQYWQLRVDQSWNLVLADVHSAIQSTGTHWDTTNFSNWVHPSTAGYDLGAIGIDDAIQGQANSFATTELYYNTPVFTPSSSPCASTGCKILVAGDEVGLGGLRQSDGTIDYSQGGIMAELDALVAAAGKKPITWVGRFPGGGSSPNSPYTTSAYPSMWLANDSTTGYIGLASYVPADVATYDPDIVLVYAGESELKWSADGYGDAASTAAIYLEQLLSGIRYSSPSNRAITVINKLAPVSPTLSTTGAYPWVNSQLAIYDWFAEQTFDQLRRLDGYKLALVDGETAIMTLGTSWDTVGYSDWYLQSEAGYAALAQANYNKLANILP